MSARYSNTSSRGREIVVETVNGSTRRILSVAPRAWIAPPAAVLRGAPIADPHRVPELGPVHAHRSRRRIPLHRATKFAQHPPGVVDVDSFAHQRGTVALLASLSAGCALLDATSEESEFQIRNV